jgi:hypothetical protein
MIPEEAQLWMPEKKKQNQIKKERNNRMCCDGLQPEA